MTGCFSFFRADVFEEEIFFPFFFFFRADVFLPRVNRSQRANKQQIIVIAIYLAILNIAMSLL